MSREGESLVERERERERVSVCVCVFCFHFLKLVKKIGTFSISRLQVDSSLKSYGKSVIIMSSQRIVMENGDKN